MCNMKYLKTLLVTFSNVFILASCAPAPSATMVSLTHGIDASAGGDPAYVITTPTATYYLEKQGGGLSSIVDIDGVDWLGFNKQSGTGWKGEYRGFPNAVHKQDGSYFHAMNDKTDLSTSIITKQTENHITILFTSNNGNTNPSR